MQGQLDYVIHDSPFVMGLTYLAEDPHIPSAELSALSIAMYKTYDNINIFLKRNVEEHPYQEYGRNQSLEQAQNKDAEIKALLDDNNIPYYEIEVSKKTDKEIFRLAKKIKRLALPHFFIQVAKYLLENGLEKRIKNNQKR